MAQSSPFGTIDNPLPHYGNADTGLPSFITNLIHLFMIGSGLFALVNFLLAGLTYISSAGDEKKLQQAIGMINFSIIGLAVMASSFVIAALVGKLIFGSYTAILQPTIVGPNQIQ